MTTSKIGSFHAKASAGLAAILSLACSCQAAPRPDPVQMLIARSKDANAALMAGDIERYRALVTLSEDFSLMAPFGGEPTRGALPEERMEAMGKFFRDGTLEQEVVQSYHVADMVVLAIIERAQVAVGGLPKQEWALRVTLVYRRDGSEWLLVHRHADPLVASVSLRHAASLARGERPGDLVQE